MPLLCSHEGGGAWPGGVGGIVPGPLGGAASVFGNGQPYGNISGAASYGGGTWTVTGAATVDIDSEVGAAVLLCKRIIVTGTGVLTVTTNCKGLLLFASVSVEVQAGGKIHIDKLGKAGNFGDLTPYDLLPAACKLRVSKAKLSAYVIKGEGAAGCPQLVGAAHVGGLPGTAAVAMQSGGGGGGGQGGYGPLTSGAGGKGGPCCGGAGSGGVDGEGSGSSPDAGPYGGPGGAGVWIYRTRAMGGGGGDPIGASIGGAEDAEGAGGGLLAIFTPTFVCASTGHVSSAGAHGGNSNASGATDGKPGGGTGGGVIVIGTRQGGYTNLGTVAAPGGLGGIRTDKVTYCPGGSGGPGSVNIFQDVA